MHRGIVDGTQIVRFAKLKSFGVNDDVKIVKEMATLTLVNLGRHQKISIISIFWHAIDANSLS